MGKRKRESAKIRKQAREGIASAKLRNCPLSAQKVRLVANTVRGVSVDQALGILHYTRRNSAPYMEKLLLSSIANWQQKNEGRSLEDANLFISHISVDEGRMLKRIRPRAQGRANRILKRYCHINIVLGERQEAPASQEPLAGSNPEITK